MTDETEIDDDCEAGYGWCWNCLQPTGPGTFGYCSKECAEAVRKVRLIVAQQVGARKYKNQIGVVAWYHSEGAVWEVEWPDGVRSLHMRENLEVVE